LTFLIYSFSKFAVHVRHRRFYHCPFRSYKNFDNENFIKDLNELNLDFSNFSDVNLAYDNFNHQFTEVYDKHVPLKKRSMVKSPVPYMNSKLRKAVYKKRQLHNVFKTQRSSKSWEQYRKYCYKNKNKIK
jgi:hypothetical protein